MTVNDGDRNDSEKNEKRLGQNSDALEGEGEDNDKEEKREQEQDTTRNYEQVGAEINEARVEKASAAAAVGCGADDAHESFPNKSLKTDSGNSGNSDEDGTIGERALDD